MKSAMFFKIMGIPFFLSAPVLAQEFNENWRTDLAQQRQDFIACGTNVECKEYVGKSVNVVYGVNDFYSEELGRHMLFNEMVEYVKSNEAWKNLGPAYLQEVLEKAQQHANDRKATLAIYTSESGDGHIALILPGELMPSGSWGMRVPNTASFFTANPEKSYVGKSMSYAFTTGMIKSVEIFGRE